MSLRTDVLIPESDLFPVRCLDSSFSFFRFRSSFSSIEIFYAQLSLPCRRSTAPTKIPRPWLALNLNHLFVCIFPSAREILTALL